MQNVSIKIREILGAAVRVVSAYPPVCVPFLYLAIAEGLWLSMCYYAPRPPFSMFLAPLIRAFMGEQFLHYPVNFLALPRLVFIGRVLLYATLGVIAFIMTLLSVQQARAGQPVRLWGNFNHALRRYSSSLIVLVVYGLGAVLVYKVPRIILGNFFAKCSCFALLNVVVFCVSFLALIALECMLVYVPHGLVLKKQGIMQSFRQSPALNARIFSITFLFVLISRGLNLSVIMLKNNLSMVIERFTPAFPELTLVILGLDIIVFFISSIFVAITATLIFLKTGEK